MSLFLIHLKNVLSKRINILLFEKPVYYITNVGKQYQSFVEELRDFVLHSNVCPKLVKQEFEESQLETEDNLPVDDMADHEDQLLISPLQNLDEEDIVPTQFQIHQLHEDIEQNKGDDDDDTASDFDAEEFINDIDKHDWNFDHDTLHNVLSEQDLHSAPEWLEITKKNHTSIGNGIDDVD